MRAVRLALAMTAVLAGCASLPVIDREIVASDAIASSAQTPLGRLASNGQPAADASGFRLLPLGSFALDARVQLVRSAQVSIDAQYYHLANDESGRWLLRELRDAAARGVRVRLLLDDLYTGGVDPLLLGFAAHANVEVRLYNPFIAARERGPAGRFLAAPHDWARINHRMHNKLFIADGAVALIGGRNIANQYFLRHDADNFIDIDALTVGAVVSPLQFLFDRYWNSTHVYPLARVASDERDPSQRRADFELATGQVMALPLPAVDILGRPPIGAELERGRLDLFWGLAYVFADHPDKPFDAMGDDELLETSVTYNVFEAIRRAEHELVASSPYFIPGARGMGLLVKLRERGVKVSVLTNSLGSTDESLVHLNYSRYREPLLKLGVELYELSSVRVKRNMLMALYGARLGRLHSKAIVIDRRVSFIGSMNLDPRSATINTELGAVIDSPELARELLRIFEIDRLQGAYRVRLTAAGDCCEWIAADGDGQTVLRTEPDTPFWMHWLERLLEPLTPEAQL